MVEIARRDGISAHAAETPVPACSGVGQRILRNQHVRNGLQGMINTLYGWLHQDGRGLMKFLICGLGSIGRRHLRNLRALGQSDILLYRRITPPCLKRSWQA